jgi:hypothetical protein
MKAAPWPFGATRPVRRNSQLFALLNSANDRPGASLPLTQRPGLSKP